MTVTHVEHDPDSLTLTVTADFAAPIERVWQLWADPRQLERWWGPPSHPATVEDHDLTPGGEVTYFMTGPEGQKFRGWWRITAVDPPTTLELTDGFAHPDGTPNPDMPTTLVQVRLSARDGGTRMVMRSTFESPEHMEQVVAMGAPEVLQQTVGQMDALLAG
jgi:uncharacterized protein YndB with AHSA1/START domain